jgi:hypothetical protein
MFKNYLPNIQFPLFGSNIFLIKNQEGQLQKLKQEEELFKDNMILLNNNKKYNK